MINVTKAYLPDYDTYQGYLKGIWQRGWLTNHGPLVLRLEQELRDFLGVKHCFFVSNGTIALQIAIKALDLKGEIITTPFSYVATTSCIVWESCTPIFVDIEADSLTIDIIKIEQAITPLTTAILATHVFGNPCNAVAIDALAKKHGLKVIYDAAHAFGVKYNEQSIVSFGDVSAMSFHATKIYHTIEGGALITNDDDVAYRINYMRNFGHDGPENFLGVGINGKNSEFHAAMGLCILPEVKNIITQRKVISQWYKASLPIDNVTIFEPRKEAEYNYAYYPILFKDEAQLLRTKELLASRGINTRRYFYPSLNTLNYVNYLPCPIAEDIAKRVLCLPLYFDLSKNEVELIASIIQVSLKQNS